MRPLLAWAPVMVVLVKMVSVNGFAGVAGVSVWNIFRCRSGRDVGVLIGFLEGWVPDNKTRSRRTPGCPIRGGGVEGGVGVGGGGGGEKKRREVGVGEGGGGGVGVGGWGGVLGGWGVWGFVVGFLWGCGGGGGSSRVSSKFKLSYLCGVDSTSF